jgi:1-acyl-sn-glycerol-3-phosphate acyltransferase
MDERIPKVSQPLLLWFRWIARRNFRREFHTVRVSGLRHLRGLDGPLLVYANHSSWWDPLMAFLVSGTLMRTRRHYAPMDAEALTRYKILSLLGVFPVAVSSARGAVRFLRTGEAILRGGGVLWVTPQGRFADARERPIVFKPGMAALAARIPGCAVLPMAIEYVFWDERTPEALLQFGEPVRVEEGEATEALEARLVGALEAVMAELQVRAMSRDARQFERVLVRGRVGVGGFYGIGKRAKAILTRTQYQAEHGGPGSTVGSVAKE